MCIFEEKLDEDVLENIQDYEFAVSWLLVYYSKFQTYPVCGIVDVFSDPRLWELVFVFTSSLMKMVRLESSIIGMQRHANWTAY